MQVRLIGYCVEGSLFLVYEFIENGNLSEHLRGVSLDASLQYVLSIVVYHEEPNWVCDVQVPMDHTNSKIGTDAPPSSTPNWTINVRTIKVSNISLATSEKDIKEFFSFSGDIQYVEKQRSTLLTYPVLNFLHNQCSIEFVARFAGKLKHLSLHTLPSRNHREQIQLCF
ncbi:Chitin elicitor receptor kinase 1 [Camellia lanceoleosa]|uniref:Chitin elicitor receptor kinase 1 n=1 Tax=Camellia lanceoleosa TaxID=1840588 RepID=A0ACC0FZD6_9ERIC|nr:Chitin elicitor receptor kinase 1 [Camellia lanceoleosa]